MTFRHLAAAAVTAAALAVSAPARAQDPSCRDPKSQMEMNHCAHRAYRAADVQLNTVYRAVRARLGPQRRELLRLSQTAWIAFRDRECRFQAAEAEGGSMAPMLLAGCKETLTKERIRHLRGEGQRSG